MGQVGPNKEIVNELDLLTLIVGLSVYVATVRFVVIGRLTDTPASTPAKKWNYKLFLRTLVPADLSLTFSAVLVFLQLFWINLFEWSKPAWFPKYIVWSLFVAVVVLVLHHLFASMQSLGLLKALKWLGHKSWVAVKSLFWRRHGFIGPLAGLLPFGAYFTLSFFWVAMACVVSAVVCAIAWFVLQRSVKSLLWLWAVVYVGLGVWAFV